MLISGGEIDTERAAVNVLDEYRGGKLGRITLEPVGRPLKYYQKGKFMDYSFEQEAYLKGYTAVCGIDEAGRGPLAGPVYAAAVWLPEGLVIDGLNGFQKKRKKA